MLSHHFNSKSEIASSSDGVDLYKSSLADVGDVTYVWRDQPKSLSEILQEETLPIIVKLCSENVIKEKEIPVDLNQPLILYKDTKGKKLHARNIRARTATRDTTRFIYDLIGPHVTFSETFPGFFKELDSKDHYLVAVTDLSNVMPKSFVSVVECQGYLCISQLADNLYQKTVLSPGLYRPIEILQSNITYTNKRKSEKKKHVHCLSCHDERGKVVLFPITNKGVFYLGELNPNKPLGALNPACRVYKWTGFDPQRLKGLRVKMMHGKPPVQECQFTGLLEFCSVVEEHTVIGSTISSTPRLFELAVTSEPFFIVAANTKELQMGSVQQKCLKFARNECDTYMETVKVKKDYGIDQAEDPPLNTD
ncbi:uncharacterized protein LOC131936417 [Physella acuta]|uniref:uncharacterized protein LOC131936417 n=1 Tax=Physella acuta TaxID=109671 RepID=UPI0027DB4D24|nr:uncharacterized protein LOC131936417 [Physella acuta]XP_059149374.1 uncharacterized protein LOC131936417 [Physella acuta]